MLEDFQSHCARVVRNLTGGMIVPFLGAGANLCGRPEGTRWKPDQLTYLPEAAELAQFLAQEFGCPPNATNDLSRVSQYVATLEGTGPLYEKIHGLLDHDHPLTDLHRFFAEFTSELYERGHFGHSNLRGRFVIVTTNYDDLLERAFSERVELFHVVTYVAEGKDRGRFYHWQPRHNVEIIRNPNTYSGLIQDHHPVILKIHGAINRSDPERDSFVITEDHYIDYLTRTDIATLLPIPLPAILKRCHLLFLGYGLRDWNLRVVLHRIWGSQRLKWKSWAVQTNPDELDRRFWLDKNVEIIEKDLAEYVEALSNCRIDSAQ